MKERPIIFSAPMVRAILDGRKTMTRRIVKGLDESQWETSLLEIGRWKEAVKCPFGQPGDHLWVRETYCCDDPVKAQDIMSRGEGIYYKATEKHPEIFPRWKRSMFMPRWASRITIEITGIKVEKLQDIKIGDVRKEGLFCEEMLDDTDSVMGRHPFVFIWEEIHGKGSWKLNPWVWVIEFKRIKD